MNNNITCYREFNMKLNVLRHKDTLVTFRYFGFHYLQYLYTAWSEVRDYDSHHLKHLGVTMRPIPILRIIY